MTTGRLAEDGTRARQNVRAWLPGGARMRRVADDVIPWGHRGRNVVHVRIWEPIDSPEEPPVVLLGNLEDSTAGSVTNSVEDVAMLVGARYLGPGTGRAQFYEHWSRYGRESRPAFHHVTFTVSPTERRRRSANGRAVGVELSDPSWRETTREEVERLVGEPIEVYTSGTYTAELVRAADDAAGQMVAVVWDPEDARAAARTFTWLAATRTGQTANSAMDAPAPLTGEERDVTLAALAWFAVTARNNAANDIIWQDPDAPVILLLPDVDNVVQLRDRAARSCDLLDDHAALWRALSSVRRILARIDSDDRLQLVPARGGGLARLEWWEAGIKEPERAGRGALGPIARLDDKHESGHQVDPTVAWRTAEIALGEYLINNCEAFREWDTPSYRPSGPLPATGPTAQRYLRSVSWSDIGEGDGHRRERLERLARDDTPAGKGDTVACGYDSDGHLVVLNRDRKTFWVEWPIGHDRPRTIPDSVVRADPNRHAGAVPVYLERPDGTVTLLPASPAWHASHEYTWGYHGSGPTNLAAAVTDAVAALAGDVTNTLREQIEVVVCEKVASPRTPAWSLRALLDEANGRSSR